jgi:hypothetical protein
MISTEDEKARQRALIAERQRIARELKARTDKGVNNPAYGGNPFEPSSYLPTVPSDPSLSQPIPSNRFIDPRMPSGAAVSRATDIQDFRKEPDKYIASNIEQLNAEQSVIDKGMSMMGRLFNYQDEADLTIFGADIGAVESTWDGFIRYFTGAYDLLNIGFGGLISAAPGGLQTLSYDELSGGKSVGQVLNGEIEPGSAPSPGQIALSSVAVEAKRIREGKGRLSDVLLMNPATAPFILAALAAESSPLQKDGFNIMDKEQRDEAFSSGYEQWMSGVTDAGLMLADPLIGLGVATKVMRVGLLGKPGTAKFGQEFAANNISALDEMDKAISGASGREGLEQLLARGTQLTEEGNLNVPIVKRIADDPEYSAPIPNEVLEAAPIRADMPMPNYKNPMAIFLHRLHEVDADGNRKMSLKELDRDPSFKDLNNKASVLDALYRARTPAESALVLEAAAGTAGAVEKLNILAPALADTMFRYKREVYQTWAQGEPAKIQEVRSSLDNQIINTKQQIIANDELIRTASGTADIINDPVAFKQVQDLKTKGTILQQNMAELQELYAVSSGRKIFDPLDSSSPFYRADTAERIMADLLSRNTAVERAVRAQIQDSASTTRTFLPSTSNIYSRTVIKSRDRRRTAAFQYGEEGTSWFPHKRPVIDAAGKTTRVSDGFWSSSQFEGTSRLQRNMRVWRWLGTETPNGYIGLRGTSTVGSEREFNAALNLDVYKGTGSTVTKKIVDENGTPVLIRQGNSTVQKTETVTIGGEARREELFGRFYEALDNPDVDALPVLKEIEKEVMNDISVLYGIDPENMEGILQRANNQSQKQMDLIRDQGYFVDPNDGAIQLVPYLDSQLANGTYMANFQEIEKIIVREIKKDGGASLKRAFEVPAHAAGSAYEMFNNIWRPATLLRLSYTQRNVFEGLLRAMAFSASAAPLLWPVKATAFGIQNKIVKKNVDKRLKVAGKKIESSEFSAVYQDYNAASVEELYLRSALQLTLEGDSEPMRYVAKQDGTFDRFTETDWEQKLEQTMDRVTNSYAAVKGNEDDLTKALKGTKFGDWREKNIKDLQEQEMATIHSMAILQDNIIDAVRASGLDAVDSALLNNVVELNRVSAVIRRQLNDLSTDPVKAASMYRTQAGRQRRIGSGKSMGPNGNYFNNAFEGPLAQINAALMSSDNTIIQSLSLNADVYSSPFYKTIIRNNQAIEWNENSVDAWTAGLADTIEDASSSWIVRSLIKNGWDEEKVLVDMSTSKDGQQFLIRMSGLQGNGSLKDVADTVDDSYADAFVGKKGTKGVPSVSERAALKTFSATTEKSKTVAGTPMVGITDLTQARIYINETATMVKRQMQGRQEFMGLLEQRALEKAGVRAAQTKGISAEQVKDALNLIPAEARAQLGYVQGAEIVQMGSDGFLGVWAGLATKMFKFLGTIPEDYVTRGGFYSMRYKAARNTLMETYLVRTNQGSKINRGKKAKSSSNGDLEGTVSHAEFDIPAGELGRIEAAAHRAALKDTREWMYTIERRTNLGKYGEWIYPFISATQNSFTVGGKLLYKEPWLAPMIIDLWRMPSRLGIEDENGDLKMPMPLEAVRNFVKDNPDIPIIGGVVDSMDLIRIPKDGFNVFMPESGFGIVPRPTPWVQVGASEFMKANLFPVETPAAIRTIMGEKTGDEFYGLFKDYIFGEEQGASSKFMSWDKLFPAYAQKVIYSRDELSNQYGYQYQLHYHTQMMRFRGQERDTAPTEDELHKRTTNSFWFGFFGNQGIPTPLTPYPVISRPMVDTPVTALQDFYSKLQAADPLTANMNMDRMFGDYGLEAALSKVTQNVGGANPTPETISDIDTLTPLIRSIAPDLGESDLNVLGILVNNRRSAVDYEQSSYNLQKAGVIPGTNREWREVQSPEAANAERQRIVGWTIYRKAIDQLDAQLHSAGFTSYELKGAYAFKQAKERLVDNMLSNPDLAGWIVDFQDRGGSKTQSAVRVLETATRDDAFRDLLIKSNKERLLSIMDEYVSMRRLLNTVLEQSGHSIEHEVNVKWKIGWDAMRLKWRNEDERWAEIDSLYLSGDSNPQAPGNLYLQELATEQMQGVG